MQTEVDCVEVEPELRGEAFDREKPIDRDRAEKLTTEIKELIATDENLGPTMVRLAWHSSGTYSPFEEPFGGSNGATMRFGPEAGHGANAGWPRFLDALEQVLSRID